MSQLTSSVAANSRTKDAIARQHAELHALMDKLHTARDFGQLMGLLRDLRHHLVAHFELEEGSGGLHDIVVEHAPRHFAHVQRLFDEHRELLRRVDEIAAKTRACLDGPASEIFRDLKDVSRALGQHEERENTILNDAIFSDTGYGD